MGVVVRAKIGTQKLILLLGFIRFPTVPDEEKDLFASKNKDGFFVKLGRSLHDALSALAELVKDLWNVIKDFGIYPL